MNTKNARLLIAFAVLLAATLAVVLSNRKSTFGGREERLMVKDTAAVALISISNAGGGVELQRADGQWLVDGQTPARTDLVPVLLKAVHDISITKPVAKADAKKMIAEMDKSGYTIKINSRRKTLAHYKLLFAANGECYAWAAGSDRVFAVEVPGYNRFLSVLRLSGAADWKSRTVFAVKPDRVRQIIFNSTAKPENSFIIKHKGRQSEIFSYPVGLKIADADTDKLERYVAQFTRKDFADYVQLPQPQIDSIAATQPIYSLSVTTDDGREVWYKAFERRLPQSATPDPDNFYLLLSNGDFVVAKYYDFDAVVKSLGWFRK